MRASVLALAAACALAPAGAAFAQVTDYSEMQPPLPIAESPGLPKTAEDPSRFVIADPYVRKLAFLKEKVRYYRAHDHGRLSPQHEAMLKRELEALIAQAPATRRN